MCAKDEITELGQRWAQAELKGDYNTLGNMAQPDFTLVGPRGFVLNREQWLDRYRNNSLKNENFSWKEESVREYGDLAIATGVQTQKSTYQGQESSGSFKVTMIFACDHGDWKMVHTQLSGPLMDMGKR